MRAFQRAAQAVSRESAPKLTVITYNILGDGEKLALSKKHDYCARELRLWASRCPRLVAEISGYGAGVVGLQECSARMFRDLTAGLSYGLPPGKLDQPESQPGLAGYHWADFVAADSKDEALWFSCSQRPKDERVQCQQDEAGEWICRLDYSAMVESDFEAWGFQAWPSLLNEGVCV